MSKFFNAITRMLRWCKNIAIRLRAHALGQRIEFGQKCAVSDYGALKTTDGGSIQLGAQSSIDRGAFLYAKSGRIEIGDHVYIGRGTQIVCKGSIRIERDSLIAAYCVIRDTNHGTAVGTPMRLQTDRIDPVHIGADCWLGSHVTVTAGARIGDGAVIGANAVVIGEIPANAIAVGIPATVKKQRG